MSKQSFDLTFCPQCGCENCWCDCPNVPEDKEVEMIEAGQTNRDEQIYIARIKTNCPCKKCQESKVP